MADLATGEVSTLVLRGLAAPMAVAGFSGTNFEADEVIKIAEKKADKKRYKKKESSPPSDNSSEDYDFDVIYVKDSQIIIM